MTTLQFPLTVDAAAFRKAMRHLAGGVSVITASFEGVRSGFTATSVTSFSAEPPSLLVCINQAGSTRPLIAGSGRFAVNILSGEQEHVANRFAGVGGVKGEPRFAGADWSASSVGAPILSAALAAFECEVDELIDRHSHTIVIGRIKAIHTQDEPGALIYWRGGYDRLGWSPAQLARAVGSQ